MLGPRRHTGPTWRRGRREAATTHQVREASSAPVCAHGNEAHTLLSHMLAMLGPLAGLRLPNRAHPFDSTRSCYARHVVLVAHRSDSHSTRAEGQDAGPTIRVRGVQGLDGGAVSMSDSPRVMLPNPGVCENGQRRCNEPLIVDGVTVGYCSRLVWPGGYARWWRLPPGTHKGPHAVEWTR